MHRPDHSDVEPSLLADFSHESLFKTLTLFESTPWEVPESGVKGQFLPTSK
jgi:hypothetical protein